MCISPVEFNGTVISCRKCWQCRAGRVDDLVGRCIAEQTTSLRSYTVTLTYGGDDRVTGKVNLKARLLDFQDVSRYLKRLRKFVEVRYVACGEYGDRFQRGHWHLILFIKSIRTPGGIPDDADLGKRIRDDVWHDGYSFWEEATYERMRYACAYVLSHADQGRNGEKRYGCSKLPPLGTEYFQTLAWKYVKQGLSPQTPYYSFPGIVRADGNSRQFRLTRRSAWKFREFYLNAWSMVHDRPYPNSDWVDEVLDQRASDLGLAVDDWLAWRRFEMKRLARRGKWLDGVASDLAIGVKADREIAFQTERLKTIDARLSAMGNRKGIGWPMPTVPSSPGKH